MNLVVPEQRYVSRAKQSYSKKEWLFYFTWNVNGMEVAQGGVLTMQSRVNEMGGVVGCVRGNIEVS